jgi:glucose/arabinose dehydrogenase
MKRFTALGCACAMLLLAACAAQPSPSSTAALDATAADASAPHAGGCSGKESTASDGITPVKPDGLTVPAGFKIQTIAQIGGARELAALPNGDLLVGTSGNQVFIVPNAEAANGKPAGAPQVFATINDNEAEGIAFAADRCEVFIATTNAVWVATYKSGALTAEHIRRIAKVRTGGIPPGSDGDVHTSTSVTYAKGVVYASIGSSCNACTEIDPTRASIYTMKPDGAGFAKRATRIRNGIAIFTDPASDHVWVGGAGQDNLPFRHPYEYIDDVTSHAGVADYGWPECEENHHAYTSGADCSKTVEPLAELYAYSTIIGAAFYPAGQTGTFAFPAAYRGGVFAAAHGSWHTTPAGASAAPSQVVFFAMNGDKPKSPVDWSTPTKQWTNFIGGLQEAGQSRRGRPTGVAVGSKGSLFVADDQNGLVYRVRP